MKTLQLLALVCFVLEALLAFIGGGVCIHLMGIVGVVTITLATAATIFIDVVDHALCRKAITCRVLVFRTCRSIDVQAGVHPSIGKFLGWKIFNGPCGQVWALSKIDFNRHEALR